MDRPVSSLNPRLLGPMQGGPMPTDDLGDPMQGQGPLGGQGRGGDVSTDALSRLAMNMQPASDPGAGAAPAMGAPMGWQRPDDTTLTARGIDPGSYTGKSDPAFMVGPSGASSPEEMAARLLGGGVPGAGAGMAAPAAPTSDGTMPMAGLDNIRAAGGSMSADQNPNGFPRDPRTAEQTAGNDGSVPQANIQAPAPGARHGRRRMMQGGGGMNGAPALAGLHSLVNGTGQGGY